MNKLSMRSIPVAAAMAAALIFGAQAHAQGQPSTTTPIAGDTSSNPPPAKNAKTAEERSQAKVDKAQQKAMRAQEKADKRAERVAKLQQAKDSGAMSPKPAATEAGNNAK